MQAESIIRELPKGLIQWYPLVKGARGLFLSGDEEIGEGLREVMADSGLQVDNCPLSSFTVSASLQRTVNSLGLRADGYDYIFLAGALERSQDPLDLLRGVRQLLAPGGRLLIGAHNRLGIRYFCGDRDPFSGRNFDGIENYIRLTELDWKRAKGRAYSKAELAEMLESAGFCRRRFYSVFPEWTRPQALYGEDDIPEGRLEEQFTPQYNSPDTIFLEEERLYQDLAQNRLFHTMANGFFIECPLDGDFANVRQVMISTQYGREEGLATIFCRDGMVEKRALYREGQGKLQRLVNYSRELQRRGLQVAECHMEGEVLRMPHLTGEPALEYFRRLLREDGERFLQELDRFWAVVKKSSEVVPYEEVDWEHFDPDWKKGRPDDPGRDKWRRIAFGSEKERENLGVIFRKGYMNLNAQHCFYINGEFVFFNQAYCLDKLPANVLLIRTIDAIYWGDVWKDAKIAKEDLLERCHLKEYEKLWHLYSWRFNEKLRNEKALGEYHRQRRRDWKLMNENRYRMNYSENEYERVFQDIFRGTKGRELYLFGSGIYAERFLEEFGEDYPVTGILDNNPKRWGTRLQSIPILSPECLESMPDDAYKIIICIKNCVPIMEQLKKLGVKNYSVYDVRREYPRKLPEAAVKETKEAAQMPKKYSVGYVAGVFDLFHIGHLNMFKRAKEQCDYLIVGVVTDESVMNNKKTMPYMSFEERIALVRSCRYVDEAVELPTYNGDTDEAYRRYHFDVQFSGSDYAEDPVWLAKKAYLEKRGATMVFFPYTQTTSSSKLKERIEKGLSTPIE